MEPVLLCRTIGAAPITITLWCVDTLLRPRSPDEHLCNLFTTLVSPEFEQVCHTRSRFPTLSAGDFLRHRYLTVTTPPLHITALSLAPHGTIFSVFIHIFTGTDSVHPTLRPGDAAARMKLLCVLHGIV